ARLQAQLLVAGVEFYPVLVGDALIYAVDFGGDAMPYPAYLFKRRQRRSALGKIDVVDVGTGAVEHHGDKGRILPISLQEFRQALREHPVIVSRKSTGRHSTNIVQRIVGQQ